MDGIIQQSVPQQSSTVPASGLAPGRSIESEIFGSSQSNPDAATAAKSPEDSKARMGKFYGQVALEHDGKENGIDLLIEMAIGYNPLSLFQYTELPIRQAVSSVLDDLIRVLSNTTGAVVYTVAAWDDGEEGTQVYESASERMSHILDGNVTASMRQHFLRMVHSECGPTLCRDLLNAYPCVFGMPTLDCRPWYPPRHPSVRQERRVAVDYIKSMGLWQDVRVDWKLLKEDFESGSHRLVARRRLPRGLLCFGDPADFPVGQLILFNEYNRYWQAKLLAGDKEASGRLFQLTVQGEEDCFRDKAAPTSTLTYPYESAIYCMAYLRHKFKPDVYMPNTRVIAPLFSPATRQSLLQRWKAVQLERVADLLERYEQSSPPVLKRSDRTPRLHDHGPKDSADLDSIISNPMLPPAFYDFSDPQSENYTLVPYVKWVTTHRGLIDEETGLIYGGYTGALSAFMVSLRMLYTFKVRASEKKSSATYFTFPVDGHIIVNAVFVYLERELARSLEENIPARAPSLPSGNIDTPWPASVVRWESCIGASGTDPAEKCQFTDEERMESHGYAVPRQESQETSMITFEDWELEAVLEEKKLLSVPGLIEHKASRTKDPRTRPATGGIPLVPLPMTDDMLSSSSGTSRRSQSLPRPDEVPSNALHITIEDNLPAPPVEPPINDPIGDSAMIIDGPVDSSTPSLERGRTLKSRQELQAEIMADLAKKKMSATRGTAKDVNRSGPGLRSTDDVAPPGDQRAATRRSSAASTAEQHISATPITHKTRQVSEAAATDPRTPTKRVKVSRMGAGASRESTLALSDVVSRDPTPAAGSGKGKSPIDYFDLANTLNTAPGGATTERAAASSTRPKRIISKKPDPNVTLKRAHTPDLDESAAKKRQSRSGSRASGSGA
ncbi:hypothetical protein RhiJN_16425 [Ceratobasidium sp. AG-Ba]|nr:hypothetical protein RhiJN_16425 [Ceratobasidium sp. AG-Ba]